METTPTLVKLAAVFVGAGLGGVLRYLVGRWVGGSVGGWVGGWASGVRGGWLSLPVGTLVVNITGCFAIGVLGTLLAGPGTAREAWRLLVLVGVLGGYTTFSAFGRETLLLIQDGRLGAAAANVVLSNLLGLAAVALGWWIAGWLPGATPR